jgi:hypothetical protein
MKSHASRSSKISKGRAEEEAEQITVLLRQSPEQAASVANELIAHFAPGQQGHILDALGNMLRRNRDAKLEYGAIEQFLKRVAEQPAIPSGRRLVGPIAKVAVAASFELGPRTAAEVVIDSMISIDRTKTESSSDANLLKDLVLSLDSPSRLLALLLVVAGERTFLTLTFISIWTRALTGLLVRYAKNGSAMRTEDAETILRTLLTIPKENIPDELLMSIHGVLGRTNDSIVDDFSNSEVGRLVGTLASFARLTPTKGEGAAAEEKQRSVTDYSIGDRKSESDRILRQISSLLAHYESEIESRQRIVAKREEMLREMAVKLEGREQEFIASRQQGHEERKVLRDRVTDLEGQLNELQLSLAKAREEERRWRTEAELKDREAATRVQIAEGALDERLRARLSGPLRNLRDYILTVLTENRGNKKIRLLAGAFDVLHRHILEITKDDSGDRIPAELYLRAGSDEE